jgi:hypothetical protein
VVFKLESTEIAFTVADYVSQSIISNYTNSANEQKIKITLPIINSEQQIIPYTGTWKLTLCNSKEDQRQSLSKALKPKADF